MSSKRQLFQKRISKKQLAANRANSQKSTGPRSRASKDIVRFNGLKHGLAGKIAFIPGEDRAAYEESRDALLAEYAPASADQLQAAQAIADEYWRLDRAREVEGKLFLIGRFEAQASAESESDDDPMLRNAIADTRTFREHTAEFMRFSLYEQRMQRNLHRNRVRLTHLQTPEITANQ